RARMGLEPYEAAESAAKRMALPVFAATLTTIIAFFGLVVIGGRFGDLIADIPFTVVAVLAASLVECFLILPNHMAHSLKHVGNNYWYDWPSRIVNFGFEWFREKIFGPFTRLVISSRYVVLAGAIAILASQVTMVISGKVNWRFFNAPEQSSVTGNFAMVDTATREDTLAMMKTLQKTVEDLAKEYEEKHGKNPVKYLLAEVGGNSGRGLSGTENKSKDLLGGIGIELIDADLRPYSSFAFVGELRDRVPRTALLEQISFRGWRAGPGGDALDIQLFGSSSKVLKEASEDLKNELSKYSQVSALEDNLAYDKDDLILQLTPQGQAIGFTIDGLGAILRSRLNGIEAATYPVGPRSASISVKLPEGELTSDFLDRMLLRAPDGSYVPLADLVSVDRQAGFSTVRRENGIRIVSVTGDVSEDDPKAAQQVMETLENEILPDLASKYQIEWQLAGLSEQEDRFLNEARIGLITCLIGIYLVLTWVFASWTRPIVVMAVIPFGLVGAIWGHYVWDVPLSMFSVVGLLGMTGIIINDSIVLITSIDEYARDRGIVPSIVDAVKDRLRPVVLTTLTTVLGLAPLLYENSSQAQFLRPTVITLVYGLGFGMLLVLLVVPSLVAMQGDLKRFFVALRHGLKFRNLRIRLGFYTTAFFIVAWLSATVGSQILIGDSLVDFSQLGISNFNFGGIASAFLMYLLGVLAILFIFYAVNAITSVKTSRQRG
ncbi:MAG: efflux RND transporter permease subunit, partial [Paracoccaceae bacterium]